MSVVRIDDRQNNLAPDLLGQASIEVMPRTAAKIPDFAALFPKGTRVYIAHIDGTPIEDMIALARRLGEAGLDVMPHIPARIVPSEKALFEWVTRYREDAGVRQALVLAGSPSKPRGPFESSIQLMETGVFADHGFLRLHVAGHPEGNRDIEAAGACEIADQALRWKAAFAASTGTKMALVTQFVFEAAPLIAWEKRLRAEGITLPVHAGLAGPAKLQTLIKFAIACGVGPSIGVLKKRARDMSQLVRPFTPSDIVDHIDAHVTSDPDSLIEALHMFPLGGIKACAEYMHGARAKRTVA